MKKINKIPVEFDANQYVNKETGEILSHELSTTGITLHPTKESGSITYNSTNYAYLDLDAIKTLLEEDIVTKVDFATLIMISSELQFSSTLSFEGKLHDLKTLSKKVKIEYETLRQSINRLIKAGIIKKMNLKELGQRKLAFVVNPSVIRKGHVHSKKIASSFPDFAKIETFRIKRVKAIKPDTSFE